MGPSQLEVWKMSEDDSRNGNQDGVNIQYGHPLRRSHENSSGCGIYECVREYLEDNRHVYGIGTINVDLELHHYDLKRDITEETEMKRIDVVKQLFNAFINRSSAYNYPC